MEKKKNKRKLENKEEIDPKKPKLFNGAEFRKQLKEENLLICLKNFLKIAQEEEDIALQYLEAGGSVEEILLSLDETAKTDLLSAFPIFRVLHLIFLSIKDNDSKYYAQSQDGVQFLLNSYIPTIQAMININSNKHRKAVLKVLTDIVTLFPSFGREMINLIPNTPAVIQQLLQPQSGTDSVRKWFIFFILSFIVGGDISLIKTIMSTKGLLGDIMIDMKYDEPSTVTVFLSVVREKILENVKVTKSLKLKVFNTQVVSALFELYNWKGPKNINVQKKEKEVNSEDAEAVSKSVHGFLLVLCTSKRFGVVFADSAFGARDVKNNLLYTAIQSVSEPWENKRMSEAIIQIIIACPDLLNVILSKMEGAVQPKESKKWNNLMQFVESLLISLKSNNILKTALEVSDVDVLRLAKRFCTPAIFIRSASEGIKRTDNFPILYYSMRTLTLMWRNTEDVFLTLAGSKRKLKKSLLSAFNNCFLDIDDILNVWERVCAAPQLFGSLEKEQFLNVILDFLEMKCKCEVDSLDSPSRIASNMLDTLDTAKERLSSVDYINIRSRVFYLVASVDPMFVTPDNDLFGKAVSFLLTNNCKSTIEPLAKIILSTGVFENNESEIDIWLACYFDGFNEYQHFVPGIFSDCVSRLYLKEVDLTDKVVNCSSKEKYVSAELLNLDELEDDLVIALTDSPTPMLIQFFELLKELRSAGNKKQAKEGRNYANAVAFRLFHYYYNSQTILNICREYKSEMTDSVMSYMEGTGETGFSAKSIPFLMPAESELFSWFSKNKNGALENVFKVQHTSKLSLFLTFNTLVSYLVSKVRNGILSENDVSKLSECFHFFVKLRCSEDVRDDDLPKVLSYSVDSLPLFRKKCIQCLFSVPLIEKFDICECKNSTVVNFTRIIMTVIPEINRDLYKDFSVLRPWKTQLLSKLKEPRHNNAAEVFERLLPVLDWFHYKESEISEILDGYCAVSDINMFVKNGLITASTMIVTKFAKMQCEYSEVNQNVKERLWVIMKHLNDEGSSDFEVLDECFMYILKKRPKSLFLIDDDFLGGLISRSSFDENAVQLAKLLLNDPNKIKYFVKFAKDNFKTVNKKMTVSLLTELIIDDDKFLNLLRKREFCRFWKESELLEDESDVSELLKCIYERYKEHLLRDERKHSDFIRRHSKLFSILVNRYMEKDVLLGVESIINSEELILPEVIHASILKYREEKGVLEMYAKGLLNIFYRKMQEAENGTCDESAWAKYNKFVRDLIGVSSAEWSVVINSPTWWDFVRRMLRICFNFPDCPSMLTTVRSFVELLYQPGKNSKHIAMMFEMLVSHSQFLNIMLHHSQLKTDLVKFYYQLIRLNNQVLSVKHIPLILASYSASLSENDVELMKILKYYEDNDVSLDEYQPLVWGEPAVSHYSVKSNVGVSLWRRVNMLNILEMLDPKRMEESLREFPVNRSGNAEEEVVYNSRVYDPAFLLPVFSHLLSPGAVTYCMPFIQKGCFAYTLRSLSSASQDVRVSAAVVLSRLHNHLEIIQNMKLKSVWLHFINCLRYAVENISTKPVPSVVTFFLGKMSLELSGEPGEMFSSLQRFLLAKPVFNFGYVPEFLPLFHSSDMNFQKHRRWLLEVLKDGIKENIDLEILFQTMAVKIILSYFKSQLCGREFKLLTLEVLTNMMKTSNAKFLIMDYGLLTWLNSVSLSCDKELFGPFVKLTSKAATVIRADLIKNVPGKRNIFFPVQVLNILMKALPNLKDCASAETLETFLNVVLECLTIMLTFKHKTWCKINKRKLDDLKGITAGIIGDGGLVSKFEKSKFFFVFYDVSSNIERLYQRIVFLWDVLLGVK
ncbi:UNVERIFIED_CONTAM: hypothetical protein PYX00_003459 [Menopon gallinae]|uniref:Nucleolar pre-ribosomal-associated protein 1 n=1 Tax=Menopon gallinae TaxID=328185 RepID=A0AAW2I0D0_9NEOP